MDHSTQWQAASLIPDKNAMDRDCETVAFTIGNARPVNSKTLFALVDVEMRIAGVAFEILGVRARRPPAGTVIELPALRDRGGTWRPAIRLPPELRAPLMEAVTAYLLETGLARPRFTGAGR